MAEEIGIEFTAEGADQVRRDIEEVADAVESLEDGATIRVDAETEQAERAARSLEEQLDDLTDDGRELRIEFRAQTLQTQIRTALRDIERLEDPVEIEARTDDLERAQADLRELAELADRKYDIEIDADPKRTARRAADDVGAIGSRADALQSGIGPLRGFTDELGETAAAAGTAGNALIDAGEASQILGAQLGLSETKLANLAGALGALGIGVTAGAAAWGLWQSAAARTAEIADDLLQVQEQLADDRFRQAAESLTEEYGDLFRDLATEGLAAGDALRFVIGETDSLGGALLGSTEQSATAAAELAVLRERLYELRDAWADGSLELKSNLDLTESFTAILGTAFEDASTGAQTLAEDLADGALLWDRFGDSTRESQGDLDRFNDSLQRTRDRLNLEQSVLRAQQAFSTALGRMTDDAVENQIAVNDMRLAVLDFAEAADNIPPEAITEVMALIDEGSFRVAEARLAVLTARETKVIDVYVPGVTPLPTPGSSGPNGGVGNIPDNIEGYGLAQSTVIVNPPPELVPRGVAESGLRYDRLNGGRGG